MSEATVGGTTKRHRVVTTIIGLIATPATTGAALAIGMIILSLVFGRGGNLSVGGPNNLSILVMSTIAGGTVGLVPALIVGLPLHHYFVRRKWNYALHYAALGAGVGMLTVIIALMIFLGGQVPWLVPGAYVIFGIFAAAGTAGGLTFWIIRRPDRDEPPIPDEIFA